jgi:hypothetical protein
MQGLISIQRRCHSERGAPSILSGCIRVRAPTEESAGWAHNRVGYNWPSRERPCPFLKEILRPRASCSAVVRVGLSAPSGKHAPLADHAINAGLDFC